jgi:fructokinase
VPDYTFQRSGTAERMISLPGLTAALPKGRALFHVGSLALASEPDATIWHQLAAQVQAEGWILSLDPNVRLGNAENPDAYRARLLNLVQEADILKLSDEDLAGLFPDSDFDAALQRVVSLTKACILVITCGQKDGFAFLRGEPQRFSVSPANPLVDTVGAGDTFMATLLASLTQMTSAPDPLSVLTGADLALYLRRAAVAAAINCERSGCEPPTTAEIDAAV